MTESSETQQARFNRAQKRWPIVILAILFVLGAIAGSVGYALYPLDHAGPWTEELAFQRDLWSGVAMIGYVVCTVAGMA
jgi:hypothetical protein